MARDAQTEEEAVHVLSAGDVRSSRTPMLLGLVLFLAVGAFGVWVALTDPFEGRGAIALPEPAAGNLLGAGFSFESTETTSAVEAWTVPESAPSGFAFVPEAAASGELGALATPDPGSWSALLAREPVRLGARGGTLRYGGTSDSDDIQLWLRFEAPGRAPLDVAVASGSGAISGLVGVPPGYTTVRAGVRALGPGGVDDLDLRRTDDPAGDVRKSAIYDVVFVGNGLLLMRGNEVQLHSMGLTVAVGGEAPWPAGVGALPGEQRVALPDGTRVAVESAVTEDGPRLVLHRTLTGLPPGATVVGTARVSGALASQAIGVASESGFADFTGDFDVEGVRSLVLGRTNDRIVFDLAGPVAVKGTGQPDGSVVLSIERPGVNGQTLSQSLQTSFQAERVEAAQWRDQALADEQAGKLGAALAGVERVLSDYPYDEQILADAALARARLVGDMTTRLDTMEEDLEQALFLASAQRCREVLEACLEQAEAYAGSEAEVRFRELADSVATRAAELLEQDRARRERSLRAVRDSFAEFGGYDAVAAEIGRYLDRYLAPATAHRSGTGAGTATATGTSASAGDGADGDGEGDGDDGAPHDDGAPDRGESP